MLTGFFFESWLFNVKSWSCPWLSVNQQEFKTRHLVILSDLFKSQRIVKLTGVQYHSQCEGIELCSCNYCDFRGYHYWTLIIYLNVKSGGADKRTYWSKCHGSFCLILVLVLRRQLNWNNSKDTEALGVTAGFMYREEIEFFCCVLVSWIKTGRNSSFPVRWYFHTGRTTITVTRLYHQLFCALGTELLRASEKILEIQMWQNQTLHIFTLRHFSGFCKVPQLCRGPAWISIAVLAWELQIQKSCLWNSLKLCDACCLFSISQPTMSSS